MARRWKIVLGVLLAVVLLCCGTVVAVVTWALSRDGIDTVGAVRFVNRLPVPPLAPSRLDGHGRRVFELSAAAGRHDFGGRTADTWGFNGSYLGPTLRARRGEQVVVRFSNDLAETTTVHWHGMHLPAVMDGGPHQPVRPGATWAPTWRIDQRAATLWYHPHLHGSTADHVYRGLAGLFLVDDPARSAPNLPGRYGVDDVPLIVQDKKFDGDELDDSGAFLTDIGVLGDEIVVNGIRAPFLDVTTQAVRLRLLNGSNARSFRFAFADGRPFDLIATDGGLLDRPLRADGVQLSPGERAEIVVRMGPGERTVLRSVPPALRGGALSDRFNGGADRFDVLELRAAAALAPVPVTPPTLAALPAPDAGKARVTRSFRLTGTRINSREMDPRRIDFAVTRGDTEVWEVQNGDSAPHNFHVHGVSFRVLSGGPPEYQRGLKDTVFVPPGTTMRLLVPLPATADPNVAYMYHCHLLRHEDNGMMGQFVAVEPGGQVGTPPVHDHGD